jgi:hypothetical protein
MIVDPDPVIQRARQQVEECGWEPGMDALQNAQRRSGDEVGGFGWVDREVQTIRFGLVFVERCREQEVKAEELSNR